MRVKGKLLKKSPYTVTYNAKTGLIQLTCAYCNGTGRGQTEYTSCYFCKGSGANYIK